MPGTVPSRGKLCTSLRYLVYSCARRRSIKMYRSRNSNRRAYLATCSSILQTARVLSLLRSKEIVRLCTSYFLQEKKIYLLSYSHFKRELRYFPAEGQLVEARKICHTRSRRCMNHFVRTVNGERVVSHIRNDRISQFQYISLDVFPSWQREPPHNN